MVFCKLSKKTKKKLESTEIELKKKKKEINKSIKKTIDKKIDNLKKKKRVISKKISEKNNYLKKKIIKPYQDSKKKNKAILFIIDISIFIAICLFLYKAYPYIKKTIFKDVKYTEEQYKNAMNLPETSYSREQLRKASEFRKSFQDWTDYYKEENAYNDYNVGKTEITKGNILRGPFIFLIQYVIPYVIVAYMVWFVIKYVKYVIAAMWGFFVAIYQFTTKKITCTLAEKWYIRLVTGWSTCSPTFSSYLSNWQNNYVYRPIAEQRINYLKNLNVVRKKYEVNIKNIKTTPFDFGKNLFYNLYDWFNNLIKIYIELPLNELYLRITGFHRDYITRPYDILGQDLSETTSKFKGDPYESKTISGKVCVCPPRKTKYSKVTNYVSKSKKSLIKNTKDSLPKIKKNISKNINNLKEKTEIVKNTIKPLNKIASCSTYDNIIENRKNIARTSWLLLFLISVSILAYSIFFEYPLWIKNYLAPILVFTSKVPKLYVQSFTIIFSVFYLIIFILLGYYSFKN